jgi:hypothetical protein
MNSSNDKPASVCDQNTDVRDESVHDPLPNPEPPVPSLPESDPGVFHHEPATRHSQSPGPQHPASGAQAPKVNPA